MPRDGHLVDYAALVDDRFDQGAFRVDRDAYLSPAIYRDEIEEFFENGWIFLCHESQIAKPHDYVSVHMGRQPVFVIRQKDGDVKAFINACSHRGAILTPLAAGNAPTITCRFHGWSYGADGHCVRVKNEEGGYRGYNFDRKAYDLASVPRVEVYRGFVFGSLNADVPALADYLGETKPFIDLFTDQSPDGIEVIPGSQTYVCDHNWKLQVENVYDGYHVSTVHRNFMSTVLHREERDQTEGLLRTETGRIRGDVKNGCYDLGEGHSLLWADRASPEVAPLYPATAEIERRFPGPKAHWMLRRGRNLLVFPNLVLNDLASTHMRTHRPLSADRCEVTIWCIAPKGEPKEARYARLRKFEDFFLVTGLATSDDVISLDVAHAGCRGRELQWTDYARGMGMMHEGPDAEARAFGFKPRISGTSWDQDAPNVGFWRQWRDRLSAAGHRETRQVRR